MLCNSLVPRLSPYALPSLPHSLTPSLSSCIPLTPSLSSRTPLTPSPHISTIPPVSLCDIQLRKMRCVVNPYLTAFFRLFGEHIYFSCTLTLLFKVLCSLSYLEDDIIQDFLWVDSCAKLADKVKQTSVSAAFPTHNTQKPVMTHRSVPFTWKHNYRSWKVEKGTE